MSVLVLRAFFVYTKYTRLTLTANIICMNKVSTYEIQNPFVYRSLRYAAYRQFTWWIYTHLGKGNRRVIPSCVLWKIRHTFNEKDGVYVPYSDGHKD